MKIVLFDPNKYFRTLLISSITSPNPITWYEFDDFTKKSEATLECGADIIVTTEELITSNYQNITAFLKKRSICNHTPIFLLSSDISNELCDAAFDNGITDIYSKKQLSTIINMLEKNIQLTTSAVGSNILIIEGDNALGNSYKKELSHLGFVVFLASTYESGRGILQQQSIDLLIIDLNLGSKGHSQHIIHSIRHNNTNSQSDIPVITMANHHIAQQQTNLFYLGVNEYVLKPVAPRQILLNTIHLIKQYRAEKRALENVDKFKQMAHFDELTGAYNRHGFLHIAHFYIASCKRQKSVIGIAYLDLDDFKPINDQHGHAVGDNVLKYSIRILKQLLREQDIVARWGGDELVILLHNCDEAFLSNIALRIQKEFTAHKQPLKNVGCSIGLSHGSPCSIDALLTLISQADQALYTCKHSQKGSISMYQGQTLKNINTRKLETTS